jgi:ABC-2 type transport system ATP-binding protein
VTAAAFDQVGKMYRPSLFSRVGIPAVRDVSLTIPTGCVFGLLGPNRAGKTTLIKLLLSLARPTSGSVTRLGEPASARQTLGKIGYMHENHAFPRYLTPAEVLTFYGGVSGLPSDILAERVTKLLERVGLSDRQREPISRFSKGMVQRLGLAQAIINEPDLLILDEPTEGLDLLGRQLLREVIREFKQSGRTVILVSHVLPEVQELCDEVAVIVAGGVSFRGKLNELTSNGRSLESALHGMYTKEAA